MKSETQSFPIRKSAPPVTLGEQTRLLRESGEEEGGDDVLSRNASGREQLLPRFLCPPRCCAWVFGRPNEAGGHCTQGKEHSGAHLPVADCKQCRVSVKVRIGLVDVDVVEECSDQAFRLCAFGPGTAASSSTDRRLREEAATY